LPVYLPVYLPDDLPGIAEMLHGHPDLSVSDRGDQAARLPIRI
jgi:hypothetical protein